MGALPWLILYHSFSRLSIPKIVFRTTAFVGAVPIGLAFMRSGYWQCSPKGTKSHTIHPQTPAVVYNDASRLRGSRFALLARALVALRRRLSIGQHRERHKLEYNRTAESKQPAHV